MRFISVLLQVYGERKQRNRFYRKHPELVYIKNKSLSFKEHFLLRWRDTKKTSVFLSSSVVRQFTRLNIADDVPKAKEDTTEDAGDIF